MEELLQSNKGSSIVEYEDQFMSALIIQLKILRPQDPRADSTVSRIYRAILTVIDTVRFLIFVTILL